MSSIATPSQLRLPLDLDLTKKCYVCKICKPLSDFYVTKARYDGLSNRCKKCDSKKHAEYHKRNAEIIRARTRRWQIDNAERQRTHKRNHQRNHPELYKSHNHRRRVRKKGLQGSFTATQWLDLCARYDNRCLRCGERATLTVDHIIPITCVGSTNFIENIQPLCLSCNPSKSDKVIDYRPEFSCLWPCAASCVKNAIRA